MGPLVDHRLEGPPLFRARPDDVLPGFDPRPNPISRPRLIDAGKESQIIVAFNDADH